MLFDGTIVAQMVNTTIMLSRYEKEKIFCLPGEWVKKSWSNKKSYRSSFRYLYNDLLGNLLQCFSNCFRQWRSRSTDKRRELVAVIKQITFRY